MIRRAFGQDGLDPRLCVLNVLFHKGDAQNFDLLSLSTSHPGM
jgi:hypothetical protein